MLTVDEKEKEREKGGVTVLVEDNFALIRGIWSIS